jgi:hypothetical protein
MKELNLSETANKEEMNKKDFQDYNHRVMLQDEVISYKEVVEVEEIHEISKQEVSNENLIVKKPREHPPDPVAEDNNTGNEHS